LYSEVSFETKSSANESAPAWCILRFMRKYWWQFKKMLALFGIQEYLVCSMCMIAVYLYIIGSSWTLILSMIVPSFMVCGFRSSVEADLYSNPLVLLARRGLLPNFGDCGSYAQCLQQTPI
jgi:hypothetical protein